MKILGFLSGIALFGALSPISAQEQPREGFQDTPLLPGGKWHVHDSERPNPPVITPGANPAKPPSDAIVLFDGSSLSNWRDAKGDPPQWVVVDGALVVAGKGDIFTKQEFGDIQLHLEWAAPTPASGEGQKRGNSGIFLMGRYEIQVLDCYQNRTYADGQTGALYGMHPPLANACLPPGQWQSYDILFTAPLFSKDGTLEQPAYVTVIHNGVVLQNHAAFLGTSGYRILPKYTPHPAVGPLRLQEHRNPVRFRNIWVRRLGSNDNS